MKNKYRKQMAEEYSKEAAYDATYDVMKAFESIKKESGLNRSAHLRARNCAYSVAYDSAFEAYCKSLKKDGLL